ncbi:MAG: SAM-dependent methyltransferase, partial [Candidatus Sumerlaeota bacterium]
FDIVIASYGILCWLPDVEDFFCVARHFLRPGGTFLLINDHPFFDIFDYNEAAGHLEITYPYRFQEEPLKFDSPWSYIDHNEPMDSTVSYEWIHDMGSILAAVSASGLELAALREYPYSFYKAHPHMVEAEKGKWIIPGVEIPMILELECRRP